MWREFLAFLVKQNVLALAIAVVIGAALNQLVGSLVDNFIMPIVGALVPGAAWQEITWTVGAVTFGIGPFLAALLNFLIVAFVAWQISKVFIRPAPAEEKPATRVCDFCRSSIDALATRCSFCTSQLA